MARVGYALGYGKFTEVREMANVMQQAEERGFEMAFFSGTIERMRDDDAALAGRPIEEFLAEAAARATAQTGVRIPATDAESFLRGSADAGLLKIVG